MLATILRDEIHRNIYSVDTGAVNNDQTCVAQEKKGYLLKVCMANIDSWMSKCVYKLYNCVLYKLENQFIFRNTIYTHAYMYI